MAKTLTVTDLLKMKDTRKTKKEKKVYVERLDAEIVLEVPSKSLVMEALSMSQDPNFSEKADAFLLYSVIKEPNLKDPILQKEFGVMEPTDIIDEIFEIGEVGELSNIALEMAGLKKGTVKVVEEVKN